LLKRREQNSSEEFEIPTQANNKALRLIGWIGTILAFRSDKAGVPIRESCTPSRQLNPTIRLSHFFDANSPTRCWQGGRCGDACGTHHSMQRSILAYSERLPAASRAP